MFQKPQLKRQIAISLHSGSRGVQGQGVGVGGQALYPSLLSRLQKRPPQGLVSSTQKEHWCLSQADTNPIMVTSPPGLHQT